MQGILYIFYLTLRHTLLKHSNVLLSFNTLVRLQRFTSKTWINYITNCGLNRVLKLGKIFEHFSNVGTVYFHVRWKSSRVPASSVLSVYVYIRFRKGVCADVFWKSLD
jgi:hypothetical protein